MKKYKIINNKSTYIDKTVKIGKNVVIYPNNYIFGNTQIKDNVTIYPNNYIKDSLIENNSTISFSHIENSLVGENVVVGPYARIRPNSNIGDNCKIGNFVEIKNSTIGQNTKISHLAYVGDAEIGKDCNIGCGAIFVNYNGKQKNKTIVGNNCFIGSNCNIIAPINIADNTYVCAGTTITKDTNPNDFIIGRVLPTTKENRADKYLKKQSHWTTFIQWLCSHKIYMYFCARHLKKTAYN